MPSISYANLSELIQALYAAEREEDQGSRIAPEPKTNPSLTLTSCFVEASPYAEASGDWSACRLSLSRHKP